MLQKTLKKAWLFYSDNLGRSILHPQYFTNNAGYKGVLLAKKYAYGILLDIGCGRMPYRSELEPLVKKYLGLDHPKVSKLYEGRWKPDILADVTAIPLKDASADTILLLQVLEHIEFPTKALSELYRVLAPGGVIIVALPFLYPLHDGQFDMARYTEPMLRSIFTHAGFRIINVKGEGSFVGFFAQALNVFLFTRIKDVLSEKKDFFSIIYLGILLIITPFCVVISNITGLLLLQFGRLLPQYPNYFPIDYVLVAKKVVKNSAAQ